MISSESTPGSESLCSESADLTGTWAAWSSVPLSVLELMLSYYLTETWAAWSSAPWSVS